MNKSKQNDIFASSNFMLLMVLSTIVVIDIFDYQQPLTYLACLFIFFIAYVADVLITHKFFPTLQITTDGINKVMPFIKKRSEFIKFKDITNIELNTYNREKRLIIHTNHNKQIIKIGAYTHYEQMVSLIRTHSPVEIKEINYDKVLNHPVFNQDVSKRTIIITSIAVMLLIFSGLIAWQFIQAIHIGTESWVRWLIMTVPASIAMSYMILRKESGNPAPLLSALISGLLLGLMMNYLILNVNRAINETTATQTLQLQATVTKQYESKYYAEGLFSTPIRRLLHLPKKVTKIKHNQYFTFTHPEKVGTRYLSITDEWQGYNANLQVGQTYLIKVKQGRWNDLLLVEINSKE